MLGVSSRTLNNVSIFILKKQTAALPLYLLLMFALCLLVRRLRSLLLRSSRNCSIILKCFFDFRTICLEYGLWWVVLFARNTSCKYLWVEPATQSGTNLQRTV